MRPAWADVDLRAIAHNVTALRALAAPARMCTVVKADGYGHGAVEVGRTALGAGADWLAVAMIEEAVALRDAGIHAPVLVLSEPPAGDMAEVVARRITPAVYRPEGIEALAKAVANGAATSPVPVHLKVNTGMHRVGADGASIVDCAILIAGHAELRLEGLWTHCAVADQPDHPFTDEQLRRFGEAVTTLGRAGVRPPLLHVANSAAAIAHPAARRDLVRCGIATYGIDPSPAMAGQVDLRPALSLKAKVSHVHTVPAGDAASYGLRFRFRQDTVVATVPIGYADGVRRGLTGQGEVLIGGGRHRMAGTVTMDQILVDCGDDHSVHVGDEVVLIGRQGDEEVTAAEWAHMLHTIAYEIVCGIGPRVARRYSGPTP